MSRIEIEREEIAGVSVLTLRGRLDASNSGAVSEALGDAAKLASARVLVDCSDLTYVSSAGLQAFLVAGQALAASGGGLSFCSLNERVKELFAITDLLLVFATYAGRQEALAAQAGKEG